MKRIKREPQKIETNVADAVNTAFSVIEELAEEMREAYDNTPESLQSSGAGEARGEAADLLESISEPDVPSDLPEIKVTFSLLPLKRSASRADRLNDGLMYAYKAIEAIEERIEAIDEEHPATHQQEKNRHDDEIDALETLRDEVQNMIDEAEGVTFPGMYG